MKKYCILDSYVYPDSDFHQEKEILEAAGYTAEIGNCHTAEEIMEFAKDAEVIGVVYLPITEEILGSLPNLKAVVRYGVGYDCVDVETCTRHQVFCCNQPDYCLEDVASLTLAMLLDLTRKITFFDRSCRRGEWNVAYGYPSHRLSSLTMGLIGFGNIARTVYSMIRPLGIQMIAYDPFLPEDCFARMGCERVTLDELYARADVISVHVPYRKATHHLIDDAAIAKMKDGVMLINTARGPIISQDALIKGCKSGRITAAALDVVEQEPIHDTAHPLYQCDNIIVTPHVAYNTVEAADMLHRKAAETAVCVMNGEIPYNRVNLR